MDGQLDTQPDLQRLLRRQGEIQRAMRCPGGIRITVERELYAIREQLKKYSPAAPGAGAQARPGAQGAASTGASAGGAGARTAHVPQP